MLYSTLTEFQSTLAQLHSNRVEYHSTLEVAVRIYVRKSKGKKDSEKKPGNKNFGKVSKFSKVLGQNVTGNKVLRFRFVVFFLYIISGNKVLKKKYPKINEVMFETFKKKELYFYAFAYWMLPFFPGFKYSLFPCIFYYKRTIPGDVFV